MNFEYEINELKKEFNELKVAYNYPQLYIWNHFSSIRAEIDLSANQHLINHKLNNLEENQLLDNWLLMIDHVNLLENETVNHFTKGLSCSNLETRLNLIENELSNQETIKLNIVKDMLNEVFKKLEKILFMNRTILFVDKDEYFKTEAIRIQEKKDNEFVHYYKIDINLFDKMDQNTTFGKLIILNEYFSKENWNILR